MLLDLLGQNVAKKVLTSLVQQRIGGRSFFLEGPPHVGKMHACLLAAIGLWCDQKKIFGCGLCIHCKSILRGAHPQVRVLSNEDLTFLLEKLCKVFQNHPEKILDKNTFLESLIHLTWRAVHQAQFFSVDGKEKEVSSWEKIISLAIAAETDPHHAVENIFLLCEKLRKVQKLPPQILRKDVLRFFKDSEFFQQRGCVYVVQDMGMLHGDSVCMLLKLLEDSLQNHLFFFLSHSENGSMSPLFRPILSRCLRLAFSSVSEEKKIQILRDEFCIEFSKKSDSTLCTTISRMDERGGGIADLVDFLEERTDNGRSYSAFTKSEWNDVLLCRWASSTLHSGGAPGGFLGVYEKVGGVLNLGSHKRG